MFITDPKAFAAWFNEKYPGAYRAITTEDVRDMTTCGLIYRYGSYSKSQDGETVRRILQYEQMREKRSAQQESIKDKFKPSKCKRCEQPLPLESDIKTGRHKEYCPGCDVLSDGVEPLVINQDIHIFGIQP